MITTFVVAVLARGGLGTSTLGPLSVVVDDELMSPHLPGPYRPAPSSSAPHTGNSGRRVVRDDADARWAEWSRTPAPPRRTRAFDPLFTCVGALLGMFLTVAVHDFGVPFSMAALSAVASFVIGRVASARQPSPAVSRSFGLGLGLAIGHALPYLAFGALMLIVFSA